MEQNANGKRDERSGQSTNAIVLLVTLVAGALLIRQFPVTDPRPATTEPKAYEAVAPSGVDARLWQDPITAVAQGLKDAQGTAPSAAANAGTNPAAPDGPSSSFPLQKWAAETANPLVLGVMVPGGSYRGYAEWRRKARFAVIAGLKQMGFAPADPERLNYFYLDDKLRAAMNFPEAATRLPRAPGGHFFAYEWFELDQEYRNGNDARVSTTGANRKLLLIWLDQDFFRDNPAQQVSGLFDYLLDSPLGAGLPASPGKAQVIILGPGDSMLLRRMAAKPRNNVRPGIAFYDSGATAHDEALLPAGIAKGTTVPGFFAQDSLRVLRIVADDHSLACALRDELRLRGVQAPNVAASSLLAPAVVLVSEFDTEYGRALSEVTGEALTGARPCPWRATGEPATHAEWLGRHWVRKYTYLRGLDGRVPGRQSDTTGTGAGKAGDTNKGSSSGDDARNIERAHGQGQIDYLRRLAVRLRTMNEEARAAGEPGIRAVGILGSDVYDKLVILQALRPLLPHAVFFTTDLDAQFAHPGELDRTRNLVVASAFGLELHPALQAGNPPFRDSYQTSLYLSTLVALTNAQSARCRQGPGNYDPAVECVDQSDIDRWRPRPRVFEIGFRGPVDLTRASDPDNPRCSSIDTLSTCNTVQPPAPGITMTSRPGFWRLLFGALAVGVLAWVLANGGAQRIRDWVFAGPPPDNLPWHSRKLLLGIAIGACVLAFIGLLAFVPPAVDDIADLITERGSGMPLSVLDGVSIWPTELIRLAALILGIWMIFRAWHHLEQSGEHVTREMKWTKVRDVVNAKLDDDYADWTWWQRALHAFSFRLFSTTAAKTSKRRQAPPRTDPQTGLLPEGERFWRDYLYQGRLGARVLRVTTAMAMYFVFATLVATMFGFPDNPIRGVAARAFDGIFILAVVLVMQFLVFFVIDATLLCRQFVMAISRRHDEPSQPSDADFDEVGQSTRWPRQTLEHFASKLNIDPRYVDQWVTIHVIGLRTKAVSKLIYYPYVIISLAIVARSAVFDNWGMPLALIIILGTSILIVTISAVLLRRAAEYARRKAAWRLGNELIRLSAGGTSGGTTARQVELMIAQINRYDTGSFASYLDQPLVRAVLLPVGSLGGIGVLQYLTIWQFSTCPLDPRPDSFEIRKSIPKFARGQADVRYIGRHDRARRRLRRHHCRGPTVQARSGQDSTLEAYLAC